MAENSNKTKEAADWFIGKAKTVSGYRRNILTNEERQRSSAVLGRMYFFAYDPKGKATLPVYDRYPLVFPIEPYNDGFLGLNMHYLSGGDRAAFLGSLYRFANNKKLDETTKLKLNYGLVRDAKNLRAFQPCIKRYLYSQVLSRYIEITADEWPQVINLPLEKFIKRN